MNYTDQSSKDAEFTLYFYPAGVDGSGQPLYTLQDYCTVRLSDTTDSTPSFMLPLPWQHPLGDFSDQQVRYRLTMASGARPDAQIGDADQRGLHFFPGT